MYSEKTKGQIAKIINLMQIKNISLCDLTRVIGNDRVSGIKKLSLDDLLKIVEGIGVKIVEQKKHIFEANSKIKFSIYTKGKCKKSKAVYGQIIQVTDYFIAVKSENYTESYDLFGFECGDYVLLK